MSTEERVARVTSEILAMVAEHGYPDWNGEGACAVSTPAADRTVAFIRALPDNVPAPEIAPEPDGSISLDWIRSRNHVLSVSVGVSESLAYAWVFGDDSGHAGVRFDGESTPQEILDRIAQTMGHGEGSQPSSLR
jgi:hypothetical protein